MRDSPVCAPCCQDRHTELPGWAAGNSRSRLGGAFSDDLLTEEEVLSVYEIYFKMKPRCRME